LKIAAFYSDSPFASWGQAEGFCDVLKRMGHDVIGIGVPSVTQITQAMADKVNKPIDDCDLVIVSGPEHLRAWIRAFYPNWAKMKMPKVAWYHESFVREDYTLDYQNFEGMFDFHFFPDKADAEKYQGEFLPLGVDTGMFNVCALDERDIEVGFIGLMYPKRARFVEELTPHLGDIKIKYMVGCQSERGLIPAIAVWDADGLNVRRSMQLLAETYRRINVFVALPNICNALMSKVLESAACGCKVVAPKQPIPLGGLFEYEGAYQCAQRIREAMESPYHRSDYSSHRMEFRFAAIFEKVGVCVSS
jgi:hypothetical protein